MADSKITQLPLSPYALDKDLIVVVTGHLEEGSYPSNAKMPLGYIRRYVVRLNLLTSPQSGIGTHYNSGLNILTLQHIPRTGNLMRYDYGEDFPHHQTISNTGLNTIAGNLVDIQFSRNSDAVLSMNSRSGSWSPEYVNEAFYDHFGEPYHSGVISITGLNAYDDNLMRIDFDSSWPHSGAISQTGLNTIRGNLIDIQFASNSEAAIWMHNRDGSWQALDKNTNLGQNYHSGIISVTGLNAYSGYPYGNLIRVDYDVDQWPYSGVISTTGLNAIVGNNMDIVFRANSEAAIWMSGRDGAWQDFDSGANLGNKYHSGIISTTGLNAYSGYPYGNLMRVDYDVDQWPYSGVLSTTGLNAIRGNGIDIVFNANSLAAQAMDERDSSWFNDFDSTIHLGNKYHSGIISVTGLNAYSGYPYGNLIRVDYDVDLWPYSGVISQTGLNIIRGNLIDVQFASNTAASTGMHTRTGPWFNQFNSGIHLGHKYHSGIVSITGVNARTENLIVKEYETSWPYTGVYYNTGLNARAGNHIEIMHATNSDANFFYPGIMGSKYQSGVISVTGLNVSQSTGNLIINHIDPNWPHRNILHTTGLNISNTNLAISDSINSLIVADIENVFPYKYKLHTTGLNIDNNRNEGTYNQNSLITYDIKQSFPYEYVLHTTGLNLEASNRIDYDINSSWPHEYALYTTGLNIVKGTDFSNALNGLSYNIDPDNYHEYDLFSLNKLKQTSASQTITNSNSGVGSSRQAISVLDSKTFISYNNIYRSKLNDSIILLADFYMRMPSDPFIIKIPPVADSGSSNDLKIAELGSVTGTATTIGGITDSANTDTDSWDPQSVFVNNSSYPLELKIEISGYSVNSLSKYPVTFTTHHDRSIVGDAANSSTLTYGLNENGWMYEKYRTRSPHSGIIWTSVPTTATTGDIFAAYNNDSPYVIDATDNMLINAIVDPYINTPTYNNTACVGIKYTLTNPMYNRTYIKYLGTATQDADGYLIGDPVYRYHTATFPAEALFTINTTRALSCKNSEESPTISFTTQPQSVTSTDGNASLTGVAKLNDFTEPLYQWQKAESGTFNFSDVAGANNSILSLTGKTYEDDNGDIYRLKVIAYDGLTTSFSNQATLTVLPPTIKFTTQPTDQPVGDDNTAQFCSSASANIPGTTISYQWQESTDTGSTWNDILGETSACLNLSAISCPTDDGNLYRVLASAVGFDGVYSNEAELHCGSISINSLNGYPQYSSLSLTVNRGTGMLDVSASQNYDASFVLQYVWQKSTNNGSSWSTIQNSTSSELQLSSLTYDNNDQDLYRVKARLQNHSDDVEVTSDEITLTVQEISITTQPNINQINGKDLLATTASQNLVATTGGDLNLNIVAVARNSSATLNYQWQTGNIPTYYWQSPSVWGDIDGETNATLEIRGLAENNTYHFYRCLVDDAALNTTDLESSILRQTSSTAKVTSSTFIVDNAVSIDDNGSFATIERDGTSTVSEQDFVTFCYDLTNGIGYSISVDANANQKAGINIGTGLSPLGPTGIARLEAIHPDSANDNSSIGAGPQFNAGDIVNIQVTGSVNQYLARLNVPI